MIAAPETHRTECEQHRRPLPLALRDQAERRRSPGRRATVNASRNLQRASRRDRRASRAAAPAPRARKLAVPLRHAEPERALGRRTPALQYCLKNTGKNTTMTVVANAEFAQSYSAQETTCLFKSGDFIVGRGSNHKELEADLKRSRQLTRHRSACSTAALRLPFSCALFVFIAGYIRSVTPPPPGARVSRGT